MGAERRPAAHRRRDGGAPTYRKPFTFVVLLLFCVVAGLSLYQQADSMRNAFEQEVTWLSHGFLDREGGGGGGGGFEGGEEEEGPNEQQIRLQQLAAEDYRSGDSRVHVPAEKVDKAAAAKAQDLRSRNRAKIKWQRHQASRQANPPARRERPAPRPEPEPEPALEPVAESGQGFGEDDAESEAVGEGPDPAEAAAAAEEDDLRFNEAQIATIMKDLVYHMDDETIHRLFASQSTIGETHSGSSKKEVKEVSLSEAQKELVPEDGAPRQRYASCALVGNARSLLKESHGREIDAHDAVMRLNQATTAGFEKHVGKKTTFRLINSKWASAYTSSNKLQLESGATLVVSRTDWKAFLRIARKLRDKRPDVSAVLLSREAVNEAGGTLRELKRRMEAERGGKAYPGKGSPSSGWVGTYFLLQMCDRVDIYGVGTTAFKEKVPNWHYFENHRFHSSREFGSDPHHSFMLEHEALLIFNRQKIVIHHT